MKKVAMYSYLISSSTVLGPRTKWFQDAEFQFIHFEIDISRNSNSPFHWFWTRCTILLHLLLITLIVLNSDSQGLPNVFSWELNISKLLVVEEVGGTNFHGFIFLWVREDEIFVNFKLGNHKDDWIQEFKQT